MILHLFDDEKIVNRAVDLFEEAFPNQNIFVVRVIDIPKYVHLDDRIILYRDNDIIHVKDLRILIILRFIHCNNGKLILFIL